MVEDVRPATGASTDRPPDLVEGDQKFVSLLGQFFLIPLLIAVVGVAIFVGIRMMTADEKDPILLVREIRLQHGSTRWQLAYDLNSRLVRDPQARQDPRLVPEIMRVFSEIEPRDEDDARTRTYLILVLGTLRNPAAMPVLMPAMHDRDGTCQVAAIQAVGGIADPAALPDLLQLAASDDPGLRKAAVFALGLYNPRRRASEKLPEIKPAQEAEVLAAIRTAHHDRVEDVRWNAALALARFRDAEAASTLKEMLDRGHLAQVSATAGSAMTEEMTVDVMVNAMKGALELGDASFRPLLDEIAARDRSMDVRQAARTALQALPN